MGHVHVPVHEAHAFHAQAAPLQQASRTLAQGDSASVPDDPVPGDRLLTPRVESP
jgi:hypothetical protein